MKLVDNVKNIIIDKIFILEVILKFVIVAVL